IGKLWNSGLEDVFKPVNLPGKLLKGEIKGLLVFGEDPLAVADNRKYLEGVEFLAVQDMFLTDSAAEADVVLPAASFIEQDGSYMACDRRVQYIKHFIEPKNGLANWQAIATLAKKLNADFAYDSLAGITAEIETVNRFAGDMKKGKEKPVFMTYDSDTAVLNPLLPTLLFSEHFFKNKIKNRLTR
ncbi:MAG TPA: molybdopterin-dependent oxidoreductase, partial [Candidatus Kapabacteria bacterium]|nr:molybdopterin-dependent oxidoreductase [Candidatus Kapabacteria bacterium]